MTVDEAIELARKGLRKCPFCKQDFTMRSFPLHAEIHHPKEVMLVEAYVFVAPHENRVPTTRINDDLGFYGGISSQAELIKKLRREN